MKHKLLIVIIGVFTLQIFMLAKVDKYSSGKIIIKKELEITDKKLPDDIILENPISLALNSNGDIFICDFKANNIKKFDKNGNYLLTIGRQGQGPGDLNWPLKIASLNDRIAVWEVMNRRISLFYSNGEFIKSVKFNSGTGIPQEIKSLANKYFVIEIERYNYDNKYFPQEFRLDLYSDEMIFIKTIYRKKIFRFKRLFEPRRVDVHQPYNSAVFWDVSFPGKIVIGYSEEYKIMVHDPEKGLILSFTHDYEPIKISEDDKKKYFAGMNIAYIENKNFISRKKGAPNFIINNTHFPKKKPAFNSIVCDSNGYIWVHPYLIDRKTEDLFFDVFSPKGNYINRVGIKGDAIFPYTRPRTKVINDMFWQIIPDENGIRIVTKYLVNIVH